MHLFAKLYPCWTCAEDFQGYVKKQEPPVESRGKFGMWLCGAHNEVNRKLGKQEFDCARWEERWRTGWKDASAPSPAVESGTFAGEVGAIGITGRPGR